MFRDLQSSFSVQIRSLRIDFKCSAKQQGNHACSRPHGATVAVEYCSEFCLNLKHFFSIVNNGIWDQGESIVTSIGYLLETEITNFVAQSSLGTGITESKQQWSRTEVGDNSSYMIVSICCWFDMAVQSGDVSLRMPITIDAIACDTAGAQRKGEGKGLRR